MTSIVLPESRGSAGSTAVLTAGYLFGGLVIGIGFGIVLGSPMPDAMQSGRNSFAGVIAVACMMAAAARWSRELARRSGSTELRRAGWAGALGFGPVVIVVGVVLAVLEKRFLERPGGPALPIHVVYGLLFVPATFVVAGVSTWVIGLGMRRDAAERWKLALVTAAAATIAFLVVYLTMDFAGWRVGAPGAAKRATMLVVTALGSLGAALSGGAALGSRLFAQR